MRIGQNGRSIVGGHSRSSGRSKRVALLMLAAAPAVGMLCSRSAVAAQTDTWSGNSGIDSNWSTPTNWSVGGAPATGDTLAFVSGVTNLTSTNNDTGLSLGAINFGTGAGAYVLAPTAPGSNAIALTGALTDNSANGATQSINFAVNGTAASSLVFGSDASGNNSVTLGATDTIGSIAVASNSSTANVLNIGAGNTLNVTGTFSFTAAAATVTNANLTINGVGSTLNLTNTASNFTIGTDNAAGTENATVNMSGLSNLIYSTGATGTGTFTAGFDGKIAATLTLASNTNSITAATFSIGDSNGKNGTTSTLNLNGTTTVNAGTVTFGASKGTGNVNFLAGAPVGSAATPTLKIRGQNGTARATINMGTGTSGSGGGSTTTNLTGHYVDILGGTLTLALHNGTGTGNNTSSFSFDDGIVDVTTLVLANRSGTGSGNATATLTVGSAADLNTATLNVGTGGLNFAGNADAAAGTSTGTLDLRTGAAVNVSTDILKTTASGTATIILEGGNLNMQTHAIGNAANTFAMTMPAAGQSATISNLGGAGINAAGLTMNGVGTLALAGTDNHTGGTTVSSGSLLVNGTLSGTAASNGGLLGGTGTISGLVTAGGGNVGGGSVTSVGTVNLAGGLTLNSGNVFADFGSSSNSMLNVNGPVTFNGGGFAFALSGAPAAGTYTVLTSSTPFSAGGLSFAAQTVGRTTFTPVALSGPSTILQVTVSGSPASLTWNKTAWAAGTGRIGIRPISTGPAARRIIRINTLTGIMSHSVTAIIFRRIPMLTTCC